MVSSKKADCSPLSAPSFAMSPAGWRKPSFRSPVANIRASGLFLTLFFEISHSTTVAPEWKKTKQNKKTIGNIKKRWAYWKREREKNFLHTWNTNKTKITVPVKQWLKTRLSCSSFNSFTPSSWSFISVYSSLGKHNVNFVNTYNMSLCTNSNPAKAVDPSINSWPIG